MTPTMADTSNTSHASASEDVHSIVIMCTVIMLIKRKIQFSARNSILRVYGGPSLGQGQASLSVWVTRNEQFIL